VQAVRRVGKRIVEASGIPELNDLKWEFQVIDNPTPNAFVLPGGKVCVFTGILPVMENEEGLATVLGKFL
jgi:predicted Zn-dependent protease